MSGDRAMPPRWILAGASVPGAKRRGDTHNEDAFDCWHVSDQIVIACVADGHGQHEHARSDVGARLATRACRVCLGDGDTRWFEKPLSAESIAPLCRELVETWRHSVALDLHTNPLSRREFPASMPLENFSKLLLDPARVYGSTLAVLILTPTTIAELSIGDAEILLVDARGECFTPGKRHEQLGDETTSLCLPDAALHFRVNVRSLGEVRLAILCTDGVSNAFRSREGFEQLALDLDAVGLDAGGEEDFERDLSGWLTDFSNMASGDDATLVMISRERRAGEQKVGESGRPSSNTTQHTHEVTRPIEPGTILERGLRRVQEILDPGRDR